ncbi:WPP domain-associated protein-like [Lycium ferocissimum]|uniref:WPP domain-associated protein-like n=1 Tax=Lycium ferocissimum TaxID=112874 RepID=UPI0028160D5B|nr:WPP domain-associated protein-like [Lycium ferocissimum]XP_059305125.1 WPP domain-associated protein-like [Lycium ferocissimum]XP_059305126.1 WPP domain-associated protein-like [Lycium ferocissimum]
MDTVEVLGNGGVGDGCGVSSCRDNAYVGIMNGGKGSEMLGDEILEDFDLYWEDINERLTVSRMVSDSLIKGMVSAVEQEAAERIMAKEIELTKVKDCLQFHDVGLSKTESLGSRVLQDELESLNFQKHFSLSDVFREHEKMREISGGLRNSAMDQLKKLKKGIDRVRGSNSIRRIGSGSELVGLGGILREQESESWVHVTKTVKHLKMTMDTIFTRMDEMVQLSKASVERWQEEHLIEVEVEAMVMRNLIQSMQEGFEDKLWDQCSQSCDAQIEKFNEISSLRNDLEVILKSMSSIETGRLTSHGSQDVDYFHRKMSSEHLTSSKSISEGNGKVEGSKSDIPEKFEAATLKHMSQEEMVDYFNDMMTKMKREHESILERKTDDYFALRAVYLTLIGSGSVVPQKKDQGEFDFLRKKIPEVIMKLEDIFVETEKCPEFTQRAANLNNLKERIDTLVSENRQLRDLLRDKKNEVRFLLSEASAAAEKSLQHSLAEENMQKQIGDLNLVVEDSQISASVREEVYKCFLRDLIRKKGSEADESNMEFHIMNDIYDIILAKAYINAESTCNSELEDSELECLIMQGLYGVIFSEGIKDSQDKLKELYQDYLNENENRIFLEMKAIQKDYELKLEVEEKEKLKQMIYLLERSVDEKEKLSSEASTALAKEKEKFELVTEVAIQKEYELKLEVEEKEKLKQKIYLLERSVDEKEKLASDASTALAKEKEQCELVTEVAIQKEYELILEVEEKEKLKQMIYWLESSADEKEKLASVASTALAKEKEQFELVTEELNAVREHASRQQRLVSESNMELEAVKVQLAEALEQIEAMKEEIRRLNQKLVDKVEELKEADDKAKMDLVVSEERQYILALNETKEIELRKRMEAVICRVHELSKMLEDFECRVSGSLETNQARLDHSSCQLNSLVKKTNSLRRTVLLYRQRLEKRCSDLQMAEAEVDLLGDEVDTLLRLLEKIYIALDHYSPVLQHYPGIVEILKLIRKELWGDSAKSVK